MVLVVISMQPVQANKLKVGKSFKVMLDSVDVAGRIAVINRISFRNSHHYRVFAIMTPGQSEAL